MKYTKQELKDSIHEMQTVHSDPDTPQNIKDSIQTSLDKAKALLAELEAGDKAPAAKPTAKEIVKAVKVGEKKVKAAAEKKMTTGQKKTLQQIVASSKKFAAYRGKSEGALRRDAARSAMKPGSRVSKSGNVYRETRINRSDVSTKAPKLAQGGQIGEGKNGYIAIYKGKQVEVMADSSYAAQQQAAAHFKAKKSYDVSVMLAEVEGRQVTHVASFAKGGTLSKEQNLRAGVQEFLYELDSIGTDLDGEDEEEIANARGTLEEILEKDTIDIPAVKQVISRLKNAGFSEEADEDAMIRLNSEITTVNKVLKGGKAIIHDRSSAHTRGELAKGGQIKDPKNWYNAAKEYLQSAYGIEPNDISLDIDVAKRAISNKENPREYIDGIAEKHDLYKREEYTYDMAVRLMKRFGYTYNGEDQFAQGGAIASNQMTVYHYHTTTFTADAKKAFEQAIAELESEQDKESVYYLMAKPALIKLAQNVNTILKPDQDAEFVHEFLQSIGYTNYKTGLLLDTAWLNKELAVRKLKDGGEIKAKGGILTKEQYDKLRKKKVFYSERTSSWVCEMKSGFMKRHHTEELAIASFERDYGKNEYTDNDSADIKAKGGKIKSGLLSDAANLNHIYVDILKQLIAKKYLDKNPEHLRFGSGGGFEHLIVRRPDGHYLLLNDGETGICLSNNKYADSSEAYDAFWGTSDENGPDFEDKYIMIHTADYSKHRSVSDIVKDVVANNWKKDFAKGGKVTKSKVFISFPYRKKYVIIDEATNSLWANEYFESADQAKEFITENNLTLSTQSIMPYKKEYKLAKGGKVSTGQDKTAELAREFSRLLRKELSAEEIKAVIETNDARKDDTCASQDYLDSNMIMDEAFTNVVGQKATQKGNDVALWNAAWDMAKKNKFYSDETLKKGGKIKRNLSRDRKFKSQQPHEQAYQRRTKPKNPRYKKQKDILAAAANIVRKKK